MKAHDLGRRGPFELSGFIEASFRARMFWHRHVGNGSGKLGKACFFEVSVEGEGLLYSELSHNGETCAVCEAPPCLMTFSKDPCCRLEEGRVHPYQVEVSALEGLVQEAQRRGYPPSHPQKSCRLVQNIVRGYWSSISAALQDLSKG